MGISVNLHSQIATEQVKRNQELKDTQAKIKDEGTWFSRAVRDAGMDDVADWLEDKDKICTDKKDDGNIGFIEAAKSFGKGLISIGKVLINKPLETLGTVAVTTGIIALSGAAVLPALIALGVTTGVGMIGYGAYKISTADSDAEAKRAWETVGEGAFALGASLLGAKPALKTAAKSGVVSAMGTDDISTAKAVVQCFKATPEAIKVGKNNIVLNVNNLLGKGVSLNVSPNKGFQQEKMMLQKRLEHNIEDCTSSNIGKLVPYDKSQVESKIFSHVNEDNFELAKTLLTPDKTDLAHLKSTYIQSKDAVTEYYFETVPRLLQAEPEVQQAALKLVKEDNIINKFDVLKVLNKKNYSDITSMTSQQYISHEQVYLDKSLKQCFNETNKNPIATLRKYVANKSREDKSAFLEKDVLRTRSSSAQALKKYPVKYKHPELLPFLSEAIGRSADGRNIYLMRVFAPRNYVPENALVNNPIDINTGFINPNIHMIHEEVTTNSSIFPAMDKAYKKLNSLKLKPVQTVKLEDFPGASYKGFIEEQARVKNINPEFSNKVYPGEYVGYKKVSTEEAYNNRLQDLRILFAEKKPAKIDWDNVSWKPYAESAINKNQSLPYLIETLIDENTGARSYKVQIFAPHNTPLIIPGHEGPIYSDLVSNTGRVLLYEEENSNGSLQAAMDKALQIMKKSMVGEF